VILYPDSARVCFSGCCTSILTQPVHLSGCCNSLPAGRANSSNPPQASSGSLLPSTAALAPLCHVSDCGTHLLAICGLQVDFVPTYAAELAFWPVVQTLNFSKVRSRLLQQPSNTFRLFQAL
jgi:hypothetical protein